MRLEDAGYYGRFVHHTLPLSAPEDRTPWMEAVSESDEVDQLEERQVSGIVDFGRKGECDPQHTGLKNVD